MNRILSQHPIIALDTCVWIDHLQNHSDFIQQTRLILDRVSKGLCQAVGSEISLLEILVQPLRLGLHDVADAYELLLTSFPNLEIAPTSRAVILQAAEIRAVYRLPTLDVILRAVVADTFLDHTMLSPKLPKKCRLWPRAVCIDFAL